MYRRNSKGSNLQQLATGKWVEVVGDLEGNNDIDSVYVYQNSDKFDCSSSRKVDCSSSSKTSSPEKSPVIVNKKT